MPEQDRVDLFITRFNEYKDLITLPDKGWFKDAMDVAQSKGKELGAWMDQNATDGDITSLITEGEKSSL